MLHRIVPNHALNAGLNGDLNHGFRLFAVALGCVLAGVCLSGCATTEQKESDAVSTIPWNRPASWEGQGALGGMMMMQQQGR
jgi:hypothetical protein